MEGLPAEALIKDELPSSNVGRGMLRLRPGLLLPPLMCNVVVMLVVD